jgi:hypothetical protein
LNVISSVILVSSSYALENLGTFGKTYPILEEDILEKIKREAIIPRFSSDYFEGILRRSLYVDYHVPNALRDRIREKKVVYTVPIDIVIDGKVIARKGERIDVLKRVKIPVTYIVVKDYQLPAFVDYAEKDNVTYLVVQGNIYELEKKYPGLRIYAAVPKVLKVLGIERVPSIVYQSGDRLIIIEKAWLGESAK